jgi:hypothetical protein
MANADPAFPLFSDLEYHRCVFFLLPAASGKPPQEEPWPPGFVEAVNGAWNWLGQPGKAPLRQELPGPLQASVRLLAGAGGWVQHQDLLYGVEARTLADTCYLQLSVAQEGQVASDLPQKLQAAFPALHATAALGEAGYWFVELPQEQLERAQQEAVAQAQALFQLAPEELVQLPLPGGLVLLHPEKLVAYALLAREEQGALGLELHRLLPALLLNLLKVRRVSEEYHQLKAKVLREEQGLERLMERARGAQALSIEEIERQAVELARAQAEFLEAISDVEEWLHTLTVARDNLQRLLRLWSWDRLGEQAERLVAPVQLWVDQLTSDLRYFHITRQQADLHLASLDTAATARSARWGRKITLLVSLFAALQLVQVFPELSIGGRLLLAGVAATVLILGSMYLERR